MGRLKSESSKKCLSILREYIAGGSTAGQTKEMAIMAIEQLQNIVAGTETTNEELSCTARPRADGEW